MSLLELEKEYIRSLTRAEKWQLIRDIQEMLQQEERTKEESRLWEIFPPGMVYEIATPFSVPDDNGMETAAQLQKVLEEQPV